MMTRGRRSTRLAAVSGFILGLHRGPMSCGTSGVAAQRTAVSIRTTLWHGRPRLWI